MTESRRPRPKVRVRLPKAAPAPAPPTRRPAATGDPGSPTPARPVVARVIHRRRWPLAAASAAVLAAAVAGGLWLALGQGSDSPLPDGVAARVGGTEISREQLDRAVAQAIAAGNFPTGPDGEAAAPGSAERREGVRAVMAELVGREVVRHEAAACGPPCAVSDAQIARRRTKLIDDNFDGSRSAFTAFTEQRGLNEQEVRAIIRAELEQQRLVAHYGGKGAVSAASAEAYYRNHRSEFTVPEARHASHILLASRRQALSVRSRLTGVDFAAVARRLSLDTETARRGGLLAGVSGQTGISEAFDRAIARQRPGTISAPIRSNFGWHLVRITLTPAHTPSFATLRTRVFRERTAAKRNARVARWRTGADARWERQTVYASPDLAPLPPAPPAPQVNTPTVPGAPVPPVPSVPDPAPQAPVAPTPQAPGAPGAP